MDGDVGGSQLFTVTALLCVCFVVVVFFFFSFCLSPCCRCACVRINVRVVVCGISGRGGRLRGDPAHPAGPAGRGRAPLPEEEDAAAPALQQQEEHAGEAQVMQRRSRGGGGGLGGERVLGFLNLAIFLGFPQPDVPVWIQA